MTREEAIEHGKEQLEVFGGEHRDFIKLAIKALDQEPRKDEVILTNKEYRELMANEYDHGYCKGYAEALEEQESILDKIRAEIKSLSNANPSYWHSGDMVEREEVLDVIDKYKEKQEET